MKKAIAILVLGFLLSSCSTDYNAEYKIDKWVGDEGLAKINSARLVLLEHGMSKSQVLETMGTTNAYYINNPYLVSLFSIKEDNITIIYYFTKNPHNSYEVSRVTFENLTPLVLVNGKLIGWGEEALRRAQDKYDITIKKDFDIKVE
jgi:outer membrane protein assembly factor BamE (lipoprotein component of BamABCDE complex)